MNTHPCTLHATYVFWTSNGFCGNREVTFCGVCCLSECIRSREYLSLSCASQRRTSMKASAARQRSDTRHLWITLSRTLHEGSPRTSADACDASRRMSLSSLALACSISPTCSFRFSTYCFFRMRVFRACSRFLSRLDEGWAVVTEDSLISASGIADCSNAYTLVRSSMVSCSCAFRIKPRTMNNQYSADTRVQGRFYLK